MKVTFKLEPYPMPQWDLPDTPVVEALWRRFHELFGDWKPQRHADDPKSPEYRFHSFEAEVGDRKLDERIAQFKQEVEAPRRAGGNVEVELSATEMKRARYVEFGARSLPNAEEEVVEARNAYPVLCTACGSADLSKVPSPYSVSREVRKRPKEDLFSTPEGLLIARQRALEILRAAIGREIEFGPAAVVGENGKDLPEQDRLWWVRPVHAIGPTRGWYVEKRCPECGRPVHGHYNPPDPEQEQDKDVRRRRFGDWRPRVPTYREHGASLVRLEEFAGHVSKGGWIRFHMRLAISGPLFAHLKSMKVRGGALSVSGANNMCILSEREDEPALEANLRKFRKPDAAKLEQLTPKPKPAMEVDPAEVRRDVEASWTRIERWLKKKAPRVYEALAPGATDEQMVEVEKKLKITLPEDLKASWRVHNGGEESDLLTSAESGDMGYSLLSLTEMARDIKLLRKRQGWEKGWLPIATNGAGDYQCVDLRGDDGDPATIGRMIEFHHEESDYEPVAKSLAARLRALAEGMESGKYQYDDDNGIEKIEE